MRYFIIILITLPLISCKTDHKGNEDWKVLLFDTIFANNEIKSIDFIEIEHPMLGGIVDQKRLSNEEMTKFILDIRKIKEHGLRKCMDKYVIRINLKNDTLRLKTCGFYISNRFKDLYYVLPKEEDIIKKYWKK
jgi:hypothetical protein